MARTTKTCRICGGAVRECLDFGRQPISNAFPPPEKAGGENTFRLAIGVCDTCTMVQQMEEVPREHMFRDDYPYRSSESAFMRRHFEAVADLFLAQRPDGDPPFVVEIGSNDGIMLRRIAEAGARHLGVDPSEEASAVARRKGVDVLVDFFEELSALRILREHGPADVVYSANAFSHISYIDSVLKGVEVLLADDGIFVFEERYLGDILSTSAFDQIYDEHVHLFAARSVREMVRRFGLELVDAERIPVHGGSVRYTTARPGRRTPSARLGRMLDEERELGLAEYDTFLRLGDRVARIGEDLVGLLRRLRDEGSTVAGYGATAKSTTVTNSFGIGADLVPYVCDSTREKQGRVMPGSHIPIVPAEAFGDPYPDYALLFAWNHAEEIISKEREFLESGGRWILYVPEVHVRGGGTRSDG
ncbi:class I SAM-dependent methyltransferase [Nocardiopsis sp. RV163]|uniref:class I SAM-dependent methyltransferase n=1 Tax=Nocardiopsis sp. RV163 TaxID=1661388 RepID=UPI00064B90DC|nr:class I SAM-dependent methyltransferase [Nocardiopsis sp. RV163]